MKFRTPILRRSRRGDEAELAWSAEHMVRLLTSAATTLIVWLAILAVAGSSHAVLAADSWKTTELSGSRFMTLEVFVDSGAAPLAAYQVTVKAIRGDVKIAGIEGGEPGAFEEPPHYDPKALQKDTVILAAYSTKPAGELPKGRTRVATIHLRVTGKTEPKFSTTLTTAGTVDGTQIEATADAKERKAE